MKNTIAFLINARVSATHYDQNRDLSDEKIHELVHLATQSPSAFNLQNWRFIAVRSPEAKAKLKDAAYGQPQVERAAVTFIVCGTLDAYKNLSTTLHPSVEQGIIDKSTADTWVKMATESHADNPELQSHEAIRSASLAAMTLMLAAQGMGLATGPVGGFDQTAITNTFELGENTLPVLLVTVGYPADNNWPRKIRKKTEDVLITA